MMACGFEGTATKQDLQQLAKEEDLTQREKSLIHRSDGFELKISVNASKWSPGL